MQKLITVATMSVGRSKRKQQVTDSDVQFSDQDENLDKEVLSKKMNW